MSSEAFRTDNIEKNIEKKIEKNIEKNIEENVDTKVKKNISDLAIAFIFICEGIMYIYKMRAMKCFSFDQFRFGAVLVFTAYCIYKYSGKKSTPNNMTPQNTSSVIKENEQISKADESHEEEMSDELNLRKYESDYVIPPCIGYIKGAMASNKYSCEEHYDRRSIAEMYFYFIIAFCLTLYIVINPRILIIILTLIMYKNAIYSARNKCIPKIQMKKRKMNIAISTVSLIAIFGFANWFLGLALR